MNDLAAGWAEAAPAARATATDVPFVGMRLPLPNEPRAKPLAAQATLTDRYLLPARAALEAFFLAVRASVDPDLQRAQPHKLGKPYPLAQCLEITLAVQQRLRRVQALPLGGMAAQGRAAFHFKRDTHFSCLINERRLNSFTVTRPHSKLRNYNECHADRVRPR